MSSYIASRLVDMAAIIKGHRHMVEMVLERGISRELIKQDLAGIDKQADLLLELAEELEKA